MKIEMAESLFVSWLKHCQECQIVQMNWKPSISWLHSGEQNDRSEEILHTIYEKVMALDENILSKSSFKQVFSQAEIDVLGISFSDNEFTLYPVDVAFHSNGLDYGGKNVNVLKVVQKCIRAAMCIYRYFGDVKTEIIFASPKIGKPTVELINTKLAEITKILESVGLIQFKFSLIANSDFSNVVSDIIRSSSSIADTSELTVRAFQLLNITNSIATVKKPKSLPIENSSTAIYKIGFVIKHKLVGLLTSKSWSAEELQNMQDIAYSKEKFGLSGFALLQKSSEKPARYYAEPIEVNQQEFYVCSEWYERSRSLVLEWIKEHS